MRWAKLFYVIALLALVIEMILVAPKSLGRRPKLNIKPSQKLKLTRNGREADQAFKGMHLIETKAGLRVWELNSETASEFKGKGELILDKIKTRFFGNSGINFFVWGNGARVNMESNDMYISGNVVTKTSNNYEMKSDSISYDADERQLLSATPVEILGPSDTEGNRLKLVGVGLQAKIENGLVEVLDDVRGEMKLESGSQLHIKSQSVLLSSVSKMARFKGNVVIDADTLRLTGPTAEFQYSEDGKTLSSLYVEGGIKVSDIDKFATAQNVRVSFKDKSLVFKGHPRLIKENDEVLGDEIVFLNGGKRVQVKGAKAQIDSSRLEENR